MKTRTSTILALVLTLAAAGSAHAQSARFAIPAARRQADQAWYQVKLARQQAFNVGRNLGRPPREGVLNRRRPIRTG